VVFLLFPAMMSLLNPEPEVARTSPRIDIPGMLARLTDRAGNKLLWFFAAVFVLCCAGIMRLQVENSFIAYFEEDTEIYRGMKLFDDKLGGTLSFDVLVNLPAENAGVDDGF